MMHARDFRASPQVIRSGVLALFLLSGTAPGADESWLDDEKFWGEEETVVETNRGELRFLDALPATPVHHHVNRIFVDLESLNTGWVRLHQCHRDIDRVGRAQIVYRSDSTEDLEILQTANIDETWVEGASVQLRGIGEGAELCVQARSRALSTLTDGRFVLNNGPFMRRFFDGYFPMRVTVEVSWGDLDLAFEASEPPAQQGFDVAVVEDGITVDATFEGPLRTALFFARDGNPLQ